MSRRTRRFAYDASGDDGRNGNDGNDAIPLCRIAVFPYLGGGGRWGPLAIIHVADRPI